jgi:alpha-tubulin suppressor-like RCC1 family protein
MSLLDLNDRFDRNVLLELLRIIDYIQPFNGINDPIKARIFDLIVYYFITNRVNLTYFNEDFDYSTEMFYKRMSDDPDKKLLYHIPFSVEIHEIWEIVLKETKGRLFEMTKQIIDSYLKQRPHLSDYDCGNDHTVVWTVAGLYSVGSNEFDQLGVPKDSVSLYTNTWQKLNIPGSSNNIISISCGAYHTMIWTSDGLFACGKNIDGRLGVTSSLPLGTTNVAALERVYVDGNIISVKCGEKHTLIWTSKGLFACGDNTTGALGLKLPNHYKLPTKVDDIQGNIVSIHTKYNYSVIVTTIGIFLFGAEFVRGNSFDQMTLEINKPTNKIPFISDEFLKTIMFVHCGKSFILIHTHHNEVYMMGTITDSKLVNHMPSAHPLKEETLKVTGLFRKLKLPFDNNVINIISMCVGSYQIIINTSEGVYVYGDNQYGQLGIQEDTGFINEWKKIQTRSIILSWITGANHSIVYTTTGYLGTGSNHHGQLGLKMGLLSWSGFGTSKGYRQLTSILSSVLGTPEYVNRIDNHHFDGKDITQLPICHYCTLTVKKNEYYKEDESPYHSFCSFYHQYLYHMSKEQK